MNMSEWFEKMTQPITSSEILNATLTLPSGARFYRCALQVNPYSYVKRHRNPDNYTDESEYNQAIIFALKSQNIEVISVTDHYRVDGSSSLIQAACDAGIKVFPGFEAVSADSVHLLCLFEQKTPVETLNRFIGSCGITNQTDSHESPNGTVYAKELIECASRDWGAIVIAAHMASSGGVLHEISKQHRMAVWKSPYLLAGSLPGSVECAPQSVIPILQNKNPNYQREHSLAIVNAQDISSPDDVANPGSSCFIKMSDVSIEGLRQAFLDPESRIRLKTDEDPGEHAEFVALTWQGGFLDNTAVHFNRDLNVLVGGRGTGKSTIVESLRYVLGLEPLGDEAKKAHEGVIKHVLKSGTKISLLIRAHSPKKHYYTIERIINNPPVVKNEVGEIQNLRPVDIIKQVEVFGQHEISELAKDSAKLTRLLEKFTPQDGNRSQRKLDIVRKLEKSRSQILAATKDIKTLEERLAALPGLEDTLKRYKEAGLEDKLKERNLLVKEEKVFSLIQERLEPFGEFEQSLRDALPIDTAFLSAKALEGLPGASILTEASPVFDRLNLYLEGLLKQLNQYIQDAQKDFQSAKTKWMERKNKVENDYQVILRDLQKSKIDGEEFIRLSKKIEDLRPMKEQIDSVKRALHEFEFQRKKLTDEWENLKQSEYQEIERAAKKVSKELRERVRVKVTNAGYKAPLIVLLKEILGGTVINKANQDRLSERESLSVSAFAQACRDGKDDLVKKFGLTPAAAERVVESGENLFMQIEELELTPTTRIELNVSPEGEGSEWKSLEELSTGQKATAVLLLLLLDSDAPLVVDQPEDDLDNRFIFEGVVPIMRQEKRKRQFIFSTHNANIPVLGDAELILGLTAQGEQHGRVPPEHMGSIDAKLVRKLVGEILEGGQAAFELRRLKYGY